MFCEADTVSVLLGLRYLVSQKWSFGTQISFTQKTSRRLL